MTQGLQETDIVSLVQANGGFIQDVEDAVSSEPTWEARRMRWDSPPERVGPLRESVR